MYLDQATIQTEEEKNENDKDKVEEVPLETGAKTLLQEIEGRKIVFIGEENEVT
ncbi:hypothetical protein Glove_23g99 [Diversispora epigaea]|uniref:Uncharacterized protein n=1 Tax=Diversispora epigaea TaxID=1348612 RepID=A0A397JNI9_9GLOM|nr:hypothetical protein Glove_23g99 [Diversispora epigaea]